MAETQEMTVIERAARALEAAWDDGSDVASGLPPIEFTDAERLHLARAVLQAIREPTPEMIEAMANTSGMKAVSTQVSIQAARGYPLDPNAMTNGSPLEQAWRAGIDAALSE